MKKLLIGALALLLLTPSIGFAAEKSLADRLDGYILLQVEQHGEAYFVHEDGKRYYMANGSVAYQMMRSFGLGITDADLDQIPFVSNATDFKNVSSVCNSNAIANRTRGKILLQVEQHGEAHYVDPETCYRIYMPDGNAAYEVMRYRGLGITDADLNMIPEGEALGIDVLSEELSENCETYEEQDDGVNQTIYCRLDDEVIMVVSRNRVTSEGSISFLIAVDPDEMLTEDLDGATVTMLPILANLFCGIVSEVIFEELETTDSISAPFQMETIDGWGDVISLNVDTLFYDALSEEHLVSCAFHEPGWDKVIWTDYLGLTSDDSLGGVLYGDGESGLDSIEILLDTVLSVLLEEFGQELTQEEQDALLDEFLEGFQEGFLSSFESDFSF